jgi:hypothetical protein
MHVGHRAFSRVGACGYLDLVSVAIPMSTLRSAIVNIANKRVEFIAQGSYHNNDALDSILERLVTALFPILG